MIERPILNLKNNDWMDACPVCGLAGWAAMDFIVTLDGDNQPTSDPERTVFCGGIGCATHRSCGMKLLSEADGLNETETDHGCEEEIPG